MKKITTLLLLLYALAPCHAQFAGGDGDGDASQRNIQVSCTAPLSNPFIGGRADGHSNVRIDNVTCTVINTNAFLGGASDGHSNVRYTSIICSAINNNPFAGGSADGHANVRLDNLTCTILSTNPFAGGNSDGHSNIRLDNLTCSITSTNPFAGGIADGHSNVALTNIVCSVTNTNPFLGGLADGHGFIRQQNVTCTAPVSNPFVGGIADGHSNIRQLNVTCTSTPSNPYMGGKTDAYNYSIIIACTGVLPVELIWFDAKAVNDHVNIEWTTASERNSDYFSVERSADGINFNKLADFKAAGNSNNILKYKATDRKPIPGESYYRLALVDLDGSITHSEAVKVLFNEYLQCKVYPNPWNKGKIYIKLSGSKEEKLRITMYAPNGEEVLSEYEVFERPGENTFMIEPLHKLNAGVYMVTVITGDRMYKEKLVVN